MFAKVILGSIPTNDAPPIITIHTRHPRIIHAEWMTHRVMSRNARSSRAVPVATMLREIRDTPFVPWHWGKNQKGMQAAEECNERVAIVDVDGDILHVNRGTAWLSARDAAVEAAEAFSEAGYHKQIANRLLEPFMWIDVLTTSTSWANFRHLRDHKDAEPHFRDLAQMVGEAIDKAEFQGLAPGDWHLPYCSTNADYQACSAHLKKGRIIRSEPGFNEMKALGQRLSVARSARISYAPFDGDASIEKELERYDLLVGADPLHASPAEHQATPDERASESAWMNPHLAGNLGPGWIQYRKTLPGEFIPG